MNLIEKFQELEGSINERLKDNNLYNPIEYLSI